MRDTARTEPEVLDTLAEVHFLLGNADRAIEVGRRGARRSSRARPYYVEQRRRFLGERAAHDRPDAPPEAEPRRPRRPRPGPDPHEREPGPASGV